jgi:two-component system, OmpR family, response regulator
MNVIRVLVVDDDPMQLELVERALSRSGFEICGVASLDELATEAPRFAPQIVLVDVNMPEAPPERTIAIAREWATGARVVLYSAWEDSRLRTLALRLGADGFISKSESVVAISRRLRNLHEGEA